jgi:hypothetical protein
VLVAVLDLRLEERPAAVVHERVLERSHDRVLRLACERCKRVLHAAPKVQFAQPDVGCPVAVAREHGGDGVAQGRVHVGHHPARRAVELAQERLPLVLGPRRRCAHQLPAELVVGDDDHRVLAAAAAAQRPEQVDEVVGAAVLARVARMHDVLLP